MIIILNIIKYMKVKNKFCCGSVLSGGCLRADLEADSVGY